MKPRMLVSVSLVLLFILCGRQGSSQSAETERGWTSISFAGGLSSGSSDTGVALGGTFVYELSPRLALEATGHYLDRGSGADAFDLAGNVLVSLVPSSRELVPYVTAGGGLYRASYHLDDDRFFGSMMSDFAHGPFFDPFDRMPFDAIFDQMPRFFMNRLGNMDFPVNGRFGSRSFTDPAASFGGGVRIDVSPHVFLRPDARAIVAFANGDTYTVGVFTINVGYRF